MTDRDQLVAEIQDTLSAHFDQPGAALICLDALGFVVGQIISEAPDMLSRQIGREHFIAAINAGLNNNQVYQ